MNTPLEKPSLYAHVLNAMFLVIAFVFLFMNYTRVMNCSVYEKIILSLGFSAAVGIHGLSHLGLESVYGYNPLKLLL